MEQVTYALPGAVATYSAKSALFTAGYADRGTFFDSTGSFTITLDTTSMSAGWSAWFRTVSGTQTFDPSGTVTINGATTYAVSNAGDVVLVEFDGTNFVIAHTQRPSTVAITGGTINGTVIGGVTPAAGSFTTGSFTDAVSLTTASSGLTIAKTTGTTLVVSSTSSTSATFVGGATFGHTIAASRTTTGAFVGLSLTNPDTGTSARVDWNFVANDNTFSMTAHGSTYTAVAARTGRMVFSAPSTSAGFRWETGSTASPGDLVFAPKATTTLTIAQSALTAVGTVTLSTTTGATLIVSSTDAASVTLSGGILLDGATTKTIKYTNGTANAAVAVTFGAVGPTGSTAGNQVGWVRVNIAGTDRYIPYW